MNKSVILSCVIGLLTLVGCENYFGDKTDLDFIELPDFEIREAAYVPIQPILDQFSRPTDVIAGFDNLIYVVDNGTQEIIAFDESGRELGRYGVPGVTDVYQDRSFDLLAIGTKDTVIAGTDYTLTCLYRINLKGLLGYGIQHARVTSEIVHPFYFKNSFSASDAEVRFTSVAVMAGNDYYVTRTGNRNNPNQFGGPDDAVLLFDTEDTFISPIAVNASGTLFRDFFKKPTGIISSAIPPQQNVGFSRNFLVVTQDEESPFRFREIQYVETDFGVDYVPGERVPEDTSRAEGFITEADKFIKPSDISGSNDGTNFIFVVDTETDSLYQFTSNGLEGVPPPPGTGETKQIKVSFGGEGVGAVQFNDPMGVAYANQILYIADSGNGRVLRFKLTTDFD